MITLTTALELERSVEHNLFNAPECFDKAGEFIELIELGIDVAEDGAREVLGRIVARPYPGP